MSMPVRIALFVLLTTAFVAEARAATIAWSPVGDAGNASDSLIGLGAVGYDYKIGTYDVTVSHYVEFLNAKDPTGTRPLTLWDSTASTIRQITFAPANPDGQKYSAVAGRENYPMNNVAYFQAIRFANWVNNGQGNGDTETGSYTLTGGRPFPDNAPVPRNAEAKVVLPNENEWYKAAYYDGATHSYFEYPTSSNAQPVPSTPTAAANHANYLHVNASDLTPVGAYSGTVSPYGAFDMGGNVWQWTESPYLLQNRIRGGSFESQISDLSKGHLAIAPITPSGDYSIGFRLAMVPEPSSLVLAAFGLISLALYGWRKRSRV